jgi:hypothetical protein
MWEGEEYKSPSLNVIQFLMKVTAAVLTRAHCGMNTRHKLGRNRTERERDRETKGRNREKGWRSNNHSDFNFDRVLDQVRMDSNQFVSRTVKRGSFSRYEQSIVLYRRTCKVMFLLIL